MYAFYIFLNIEHFIKKNTTKKIYHYNFGIVFGKVRFGNYPKHFTQNFENLQETRISFKGTGICTVVNPVCNGRRFTLNLVDSPFNLYSCSSTAVQLHYVYNNRYGINAIALILEFSLKRNTWFKKQFPNPRYLCNLIM